MGGRLTGMNRKLEAIIFSIFLSLGIVSNYLRTPSFDSDILWSIAVGKWIAIHKTFPVVDSFSWTIYGKEWMTHEWAFCFLSYKLNDIFGSLGLYLLVLVPITITIYVLYLIGKKDDQYNSYTFLLVLTLGVFVLYLFTLPFRAYIFALMFFTILIYLLYFKESSKQDLLAYIVLFVLWANFHIFVFIGLAMLSLEMIRQAIIHKKYNKLLIVLYGMLATLLNPYGYKIWTYFISTLTSMGEYKSIMEWRAPDFNNLSMLVFYLIIASTMILFQFKYFQESLLEKSKNPIENEAAAMRLDNIGPTRLAQGFHLLFGFVSEYFSATNCLLFLFWGFYIYSLYSIRMVFYAIILWIILAAYYAGKNAKLNFTTKTYYILIGFFALFMLGNLIYSKSMVKNIIEYDNKISPVEEVNFLKDNPVYQRHLFNDYLFGAYLILNDIPVFIDARCDSYVTFGIQKKYSAITLLQDDPQKILDEMGVENIIIVNDSPLGRYLAVNQRWRLVYRGPSASIFTKTTSRQVE
jgi:hypothetical protein